MAKTDARVRYTKHVIKKAFLSLLIDKPVNKITVKEVCELAELNRATFYSHYTDCFDLLDSIEQELVDAFGESLKLVSTTDVSILIEALYSMVDKNKIACQVLIFNGSNSSVIKKMIDLARQASIEYWKTYLRRATDVDLDMLYTHLSNGLMNVVVGGYYKYSREEIIGFVNAMVKSSFSLYM